MSKIIPGVRRLEELLVMAKSSLSISLSFSLFPPPHPSLPLFPHSLSIWLPWAYSKQDSLRILEFLTWQLEQKQKLSGVFKIRPRAFDATCYRLSQSQGSARIEAKGEKYPASQWKGGKEFVAIFNPPQTQFPHPWNKANKSYFIWLFWRLDKMLVKYLTFTWHFKW